MRTQRISTKCIGCSYALAIVVLGSAIASGARAQPPDIDALLPIQRIQLQPERAAKEMEKVQTGGLVLWPLPEFEARLARARKTLASRVQKPALLRAVYTAELVGRSLSNGRGQWTVQQTGLTPGLLPIDPLNLALHQPTWEQGGGAIVADFDGRAPGLLVPNTGTQVCLFDWSARGIPSSDGLVFSLAFPACAWTTFELTLPADHWLFIARNNVLVSGPLAAASPQQRLWRVQATGLASLDVMIRKVTSAKGPAPTMFARVQVSQTVAAERVALEHDFQVDILHGSVQTLTLESDDALQPYDVFCKGNEIKTWLWQETPAKKDAKGKPLGKALGVLTVEFRQPVQGRITSLRVKSLAPRPAGKLWSSPAMSVRDAQPRGETLQLHVQPDVAAVRWDLGTFQVLDVVTEEGASTCTLADTAQSPNASRRPSVVLLPHSVDATAKETIEWRVSSRDALLAADFEIAVVRGSLVELVAQMPKPALGYRIESLEMQPKDVLKSWHLAGETLVVELKQPIQAGKKTVLRIHLRSPLRTSPGTARLIEVPELTLRSSAKREGTMAVHVDPALHPRLIASSLPPAPFTAALQDGKPAPGYRFDYRDQRLTALVQVVPDAVPIDWRGKHRVALSEQGATVRLRWELEPTADEPESFELRFAPSFPESWRILPEEGSVRIHHWERLPTSEALPHLLRFASWNGFQALASQAALPVGARWRFHLAEPLRGRASFTIEAMLPAGVNANQWQQLALLMPNPDPWHTPAGLLAGQRLFPFDGSRAWSIPLVVPVQDYPSADEIVVDSPFEPLRGITAGGMFMPGTGNIRMPDKVTHESAWRLPPSPASPELTVWTRPEQRTASALERCDDARLTTYVHRDGRILHRMEFRLWHWRDRTCTLGLPAGFQIVAAAIDGQALNRMDVKQDAALTRLMLPVDPNVPSVRCEVFAAAPLVDDFLVGFTAVTTAMVEWPAPPLTLQRRLFLAKELVPLDDESLTQVGVPRSLAKSPATLNMVHRIWNWGRSWLPFATTNEVSDTLESQKQAVLAQEISLRTAGVKIHRFGSVLERFALDHLKDRAPLMIDTIAFRQLGLTPDTIIPASSLRPRAGDRPFWEALGLTYLPTPRGAVLTSTTRMQQLGIVAPADAVALDPAIEEAILHGRDASAGFSLVTSWLAQEASHENAAVGLSEHEVDAATMSEWRYAGESGRILLVEAWRGRLLGWMLALLLVPVFWRAQRMRQGIGGLRLHLALVTAFVLCLFWLPLTARELFAWPAFFLTILAFIVRLGAMLFTQNGDVPASPTTISSPATTLAGMLILLILGAAGGATAQGPAARAHTVFLVPTPKPVALLSPELITRLDELDQLPPVGTQSAVLVRAKYAGVIDESKARFDAEFDLHSFMDQTTLLLPLVGVQLHEAIFLNGVPVFLHAQKNGYSVPLRGKGMHRLRLSFTVRIVSAGDHLDLKFSAPKLVQNELTLKWTDPVQTAHVLHGWGAEERVAGPGQTIQELRAQLGYEATVHVRFGGGAAPLAKNIEVKEAHFWDLRPGSLALWSSMHYAIGKGTLSQIRVSLPEGLHVLSVDASAAFPVSTAAPIVVKSWQILGKANDRRLQIDFAQPVAGNVLLQLELFPQLAPREKTLLLNLPGPLQARSLAGMVGYRLDAQELRSTVQNLSVQGVGASDFEQLWKKQNGRPIPAASRAYNFQRKEAVAGLKSIPARLELIIQSGARTVRTHLDWKVDRHFADVRGKFTFASPAEPMTLLEFQLDPTLSLADVAGADVARWTLHESTLQVWLRSPKKQTSLQLSGWRPLLTKGPVAAKTAFIAPKIVPLGVDTVSASIELHPAVGTHIDAAQPRFLRSLAADRHYYVLDDVLTKATFWLRSEPASVQASLLTRIHVDEPSLDLRHGMRLTTDRGTLPPLKLHVRDADSDRLTLHAPGAMVQRLKSTGKRDAAWLLQYPAQGLPQEVFITLRQQGSSALPTAALPIVELEGLPWSASWVAWKDVELRNPTSGKKLAHDPTVKETSLVFPQNGRFRDETGWNYSDRPKALRVSLIKPTARGSLRILSAREDVYPDDRSQWTHEMTLWVHAPNAGELSLRFPAEVAQIHVHDGERLIPPRRGSATTLALPLEGRAQPYEIRLRWRYAPSAERRETPNLASVQIEPATLPGHPRHLWITNDLRVSLDLTPAPTLLARLLAEAETHTLLSAATLERGEDAAGWIASRQQAFFSALARAQYALGALKHTRATTELDHWRERIKDLSARNAALARQHRYDRAREEAEKSNRHTLTALEDSRPAEGIPWPIGPERVLTPLSFVDADAVANARMQSETLLIAGVFLLLISCFRRGVLVMRALAPEIGMALLAALMVLHGPSVLGLLLIGLLIGVRVALFALPRRPGSAAPGANASQQGPTVIQPTTPISST